MIDENFWFPNFSIIANAYRKVNRISRKSVKFYINFTIEKQYRRFEMKRRARGNILFVALKNFHNFAGFFKVVIEISFKVLEKNIPGFAVAFAEIVIIRTIIKCSLKARFLQSERKNSAVFTV